MSMFVTGCVSCVRAAYAFCVEERGILQETVLILSAGNAAEKGILLCGV